MILSRLSLLLRLLLTQRANLMLQVGCFNPCFVLCALSDCHLAASSDMTKQTTALPPNAPPPVASGPQTASSSSESITTESTFTASSIPSPNNIEMPARLIPTQVAAQRFEQMASIVNEELRSSSTGPDATIEHILKSPTHTLAPWRESISTQSESILFQGKFQALCIVLMFIMLFVIIGFYFVIRFYYRRFQRGRAEAKARVAIADDEFFPKDVGLDWVKPVKEVTEYKRSNMPVGLEWQIKAMKEEAEWQIKARKEGGLTRKSANSFKRRREDRICSVPDYYFMASPTEPEVEPTTEFNPRKSLDSTIEEERKQATRSSFDFGDLAGQTISGK
jgi:hypothetical protein